MKVILHRNNVPPALWGDSMSDPSTDPANIAAYWRTHLPAVQTGADGWWPDDGDNLPIEARLARHRLYYEGSLQALPNERPWALHRNGYAGMVRYGGWIWSGDVQSRWITLQSHIATGLNASVSASPFWGTDTGGFFMPPTPPSTIPNDLTGELYVRWFQFSAFNPLFRSHGRNWHLHTPWGWNTGAIGPKEQGATIAYPAETELHNADVEPICQKYLNLRYQLLPYNYSLMREVCDTGMPPMRPLWLAYPNDPHSPGIADEYLWGENLLVAPVVEKGATSRRLYLPPGSWYDYWTGQVVAGGKWITRSVDLATMPLYVKAGAILPMDPVRQYTGEPATEPTTLHIYPGADAQFTLYDDDGHTTAYLTHTDPQEQYIRITWNDAQRQLTLNPDPRMKSWPAGLQRDFRIHLQGTTDIAPLRFTGTRIDKQF
jgi:alpha-glucosidase/alpha-D-xyloside xylohydrolase